MVWLEEWLSKKKGIRIGSQDEQDFMKWLVEELNEMRVDKEVIDMVVEDLDDGSKPVAKVNVFNECVRTVSCPGGCHG